MNIAGFKMDKNLQLDILDSLLQQYHFFSKLISTIGEKLQKIVVTFLAWNI